MICGCTYPIIHDKGTMTVGKVQSYHLDGKPLYKYKIYTGHTESYEEAAFITYSNKFYPVGTYVSIMVWDEDGTSASILCTQ